MSASPPDHAKGLLLAACGGLALTFDIPVLRLANGDPWSVMLMRSALVFGVAVTYMLATRVWYGRMRATIPGKAGWLATALYGASAVTFLMAVFNTSTANLVFILAFNPMFAALLSWLFLGERPKTVTLAAMAVMAVGVLVIVHEGLGAGNFLGDVLALSSGLTIAGAITVTRGSGKDMGFTPLIGSAAPLFLAAFMVGDQGFHVELPWWLVLNGMVVIPVSFFCLATAPKYVSGAEVAMFYLLETVLAPIWVWLIFAEMPSRQSLIGGVILVATLSLHSLWQLREGRRRRAARAVRHPP